MEFVYLAIAIVVLAVIVGGLLLLRGRGRTAAPPPVKAPKGGGTGVLEEETAPAEAPSVEVPAPPAPEIELPPPSAGRLLPLRARLSRSQNALGRSLLTLLSRDALDDDAWDEIEDILVTADVGVAPARQIGEEPRTQGKGLGSP